MESFAPLTYWLALGTVALQIAIVYLVIEHLFFSQRLSTPYISQYGAWIILGSSTIVVALTLVYSEIFGLVPCGLCWLERVCLYPIPVIAFLMLWRKKISGYAIAATEMFMTLSALGGIIALYHHYLQMGGSALIECPAAGEGADCARRVIFEFGYITFPLMAFTIFAFIFVVAYVYRCASRGEQSYQ